jgi:hypothetical protein
MKKLLLTILILTFAFSCTSDKTHDKAISTSVKVPPAPGTQMTNEFKNIDTIINLSFYDLTPYATKFSYAREKALLANALKSACVEQEEYYKSKDFYFTDLDNDSDLDLVYSSNFDQYKLIDGNFTLLLRNDNEVYKKYRIPGFLYEVDFSKMLSGQIVLKTAERPCCDYFNYNFYETTFDTKSWTINTKHVLEIHQSKVHERKTTAYNKRLG